MAFPRGFISQKFPVPVGVIDPQKDDSPFLQGGDGLPQLTHGKIVRIAQTDTVFQIGEIGFDSLPPCPSCYKIVVDDKDLFCFRVKREGQFDRTADGEKFLNSRDLVMTFEHGGFEIIDAAEYYGSPRVELLMMTPHKLKGVVIGTKNQREIVIPVLQSHKIIVGLKILFRMKPL